MSVAEEIDETETPKKGGKFGLILGLVLAICVGGGGFYATYNGMILSSAPESSVENEPKEEVEQEIAKARFIALDPLVVSIRSSSKFRLLRFTGQLEVSPEKYDAVNDLKPRIIDVMNTYLNAVDAASFEDPIAMIRLRSQLLRRAQIVTGPETVKDLLIMEFVLQ